MTSEFSSGMIRATFAAAPRRPLVLAAKAAIIAGVALVAGEILAFVAFGVGEVVLKNPAPHASLGQPGVLRAVLLAGAYPALIALIGLGLGALIRHTAGAISAVVGVLFVLPLILLPLGTSIQNSVGQFLPMPIAENSLTAVKPVAHSLSAGVAFAVLVGYAAVALAAAAGRWPGATRERRPLAGDNRAMDEDIRRVAGTVLRAPLTRRTLHELLYCGFGGITGVIGFCLTVVMLAAGLTISASILGTVVGLLLLTLALRVTRRLGGLHRRLARWLLGYQVEAPPKFQPGTGILNRLDKRLRDRAAWRGVSYNLIKLPVAAVQLYAATIACIGLVDITYPVDWVLFRNNATGPMVVVFPFPFGGTFHVYGFAGTYLAALAGAFCVLAATWLARGITPAIAGWSARCSGRAACPSGSASCNGPGRWR